MRRTHLEVLVVFTAAVILLMGFGGTLAPTEAFTPNCCSTSGTQGSYQQSITSSQQQTTTLGYVWAGIQPSSGGTLTVGPGSQASLQIPLSAQTSLLNGSFSITSNGGSGTGGQTTMYQWTGPAGTDPGASISATFTGSGSVVVGGSTAGGSQGSSSGNGSSSGGGGGNVDNPVSASISNVGGSCTLTTGTNLNGSFTGNAGYSQTPSAGPGSFSDSAQWSIIAGTSGGVNCGGGAIVVYTQAQVSGGGSISGANRLGSQNSTTLSVSAKASISASTTIQPCP